jgi:hypothetical protein
MNRDKNSTIQDEEPECMCTLIDDGPENDRLLNTKVGPVTLQLTVPLPLVFGELAGRTRLEIDRSKFSKDELENHWVIGHKDFVSSIGVRISIKGSYFADNKNGTMSYSTPMISILGGIQSAIINGGGSCWPKDREAQVTRKLLDLMEILAYATTALELHDTENALRFLSQFPVENLLSIPFFTMDSPTCIKDLLESGLVHT